MSLDITQVADFLKSNPDFLSQNPGILAFVHLPTPAVGNVASLQERQVQTMRDKVKSLEQKLVTLSGAAVENQAIMGSLQLVQQRLLMVQNAADLQTLLPRLLSQHFNVPMVHLQLWSGLIEKRPDFNVVEASLQERQSISALPTLYCGFSENAPSLSVFDMEEIKPRSVVLIPLRIASSPEVFGCLGFGSPDKDRFAPSLETDFLNTIAETACAALSRLLAK